MQDWIIGFYDDRVSPGVPNADFLCRIAESGKCAVWRSERATDLHSHLYLYVCDGVCMYVCMYMCEIYIYI